MRPLGHIEVRRALRLVVLLVLACACSDSHAQCTYAVQVLTKPTDWSSIGWSDQSEEGTAVGHFTYPSNPGVKHSFRWRSDTGFQVLTGPPGASDKTAEVVTETGLIAGAGHIAGFPEESKQFLLWQDGNATSLPLPDPSYYVSLGDADGDGFAVGSFGSGDVGLFPFVSQNGRMLALPREIASAYGQVDAVNDAGMIGGYRKERKVGPASAYLGSLESVTFLPIIPGTIYPSVYGLTRQWHAAIRARQDVSGVKFVGYFWNGTSPQFMGFLPGAEWLRPATMNEVDQVVGTSGHNSPGSFIRGFLWQAGSLYDLDSIALLPAGAKIRGGLAIHEDGTIFAEGSYQSGTVAFILTPLTVDPADITLDCKVDVNDLMRVLDEWGATADAAVPRADIDGDGMIGAGDLALVLGAWTAR